MSDRSDVGIEVGVQLLSGLIFIRSGYGEDDRVSFMTPDAARAVASILDEAADRLDDLAKSHKAGGARP
jgi:hypothetical protein